MVDIMVDTSIQPGYISNLKRCFDGTRYSYLIRQIDKAYAEGDSKKLSDCISQLPNEETMLAELIEKLKGKSVYKTLKRVMYNKTPSYVALKAMLSLATHIVIEIEKGRGEYCLLLESVFARCAALMEEIHAQKS